MLGSRHSCFKAKGEKPERDAGTGARDVRALNRRGYEPAPHKHGT